MQVDSPANSQGEEEEEEKQPWESTRAAKRIAELKEVEDNIAVLLHFAGCGLASLHPDPLSSFTSRELAVEGEEEPSTTSSTTNQSNGTNGEGSQGQSKAAEFAKYADAYYTTLNDVQVGLRTSIRHLRVARTSAAPLLDPSYGSLAGSSSTGRQPSQVGVGGVALAQLLEPVGRGHTSSKEGERITGDDRGTRDETMRQLSVAAKEIEREAWSELVDVLSR